MSNCTFGDLADKLRPGQTATVVTEKSTGSGAGKFVIGIIVVLLLLAIFIYAAISGKKDENSPPVAPVTPNDAKLARPTKMGDCGYPNKPRGWYDTKKRGVRNDYCRYVGDWPGKWVCNVQGTKADGSDSVESALQYSESEPFDPYQDTMQGFNCQ